MDTRHDGADDKDGDSVAGLTSAMAQGDEGAFRRFHADYWPRIYAWLMVATYGDESLSEELTQKTMINAARHIKPFQAEDELWAWLRTIARNVFLDACRARSRKPAFVEWESQHDLPENSQDTSERRLVELLEECIRKLNPDDRELVERIHLNGDDRETAAREWNLSYKGLDSRLVRARARLRQMMLRKLRHE